jgi:hypothetical protein
VREDKASEDSKAREGRLQRDGLDNVGGDEDLEAEQQCATDAAPISLVAVALRPAEEADSRPQDAEDDDDHAEDVDRSADKADPMGGGGF